MPSAKSFFSDQQLTEIEQSVHAAEKNTSGEIRVHIENYCTGELLHSAWRVFRRLGMHKTALRNGVLFFVAVKDQKFAVVGDEGIHKNVPQGFWDSVKDKVLERFRKQEFTEGLCEGIAMAGHELKKYFPYSEKDKNELSDEINFGKR